MMEGRDHAAKIFDTQGEARRACKPFQDQVPVAVTYANLAKSLLKGAPFCFETEAVYDRFIKALRNDMSNKPFLSFSRDRNFVRWRHTPNAKADPASNVGADARSEPVPAAAPSVESRYNADILVRESNG